MEKRPPSSFLRLLSEPSFDFTPYFDKAVIEWLRNNMGDFLKEAPEACAFFIKEEQYRALVAANIKLEAKNDEILTSFIKEFDSGNAEWYSQSALDELIPRLIAYGKPDMVLLCPKTLAQMHGENLKTALAAISDATVRSLFGSMSLTRTRWDTDSICQFLGRLPSDLLVQVDPNKWEWLSKENTAKLVSTLAKRWPLENIAEFLARWGTKYPALSCMCCGDKVAKSKPGYTLHRKVCDPHREHENIWTVIAERTQ